VESDGLVTIFRQHSVIHTDSAPCQTANIDRGWTVQLRFSRPPVVYQNITVVPVLLSI